MRQSKCTFLHSCRFVIFCPRVVWTGKYHMILQVASVLDSENLLCPVREQASGCDPTGKTHMIMRSAVTAWGAVFGGGPTFRTLKSGLREEVQNQSSGVLVFYRSDRPPTPSNPARQHTPSFRMQAKRAQKLLFGLLASARSIFPPHSGPPPNARKLKGFAFSALLKQGCGSSGSPVQASRAAPARMIPAPPPRLLQRSANHWRATRRRLGSPREGSRGGRSPPRVP